ncbi:hypothetical protein AB8O38_05545 [Saccharomonospora xinjiangensis]|uniref:hypothetical protein n=1 Tax=Saccharomonospora xinjiangensis TaxID=75294 RepID=UPI00350FF520
MSIFVGALLGLALFFGLVFAVKFFSDGDVVPGVLSSLVASAPVVVLLHGAVRNRIRSLPRKPVREPPPRAVVLRRRRAVVLALLVALVLAVVLA